MVPDVATGDPNAMLCLHCARRVVAPISKGKYDGLESHLKFRAAFTSLVKLPFARIDGLIGSSLPMAAFRDEAWWSNSSSSAHAKAWLNAGWEVQEINLKEGYVVFKKVRNVSIKKGARRKLEINKPFTPVPVHRPRSKVPSKTKVSKLYARIKNMERNRLAERRQIRGFKARARR
jgi:hypothetical protein